MLTLQISRAYTERIRKGESERKYIHDCEAEKPISFFGSDARGTKKLNLAASVTVGVLR